MGSDFAVLDATAQADLVRRGEVQPIELVDAAIAGIEKLNPQLNAVIIPTFDKAREQARSGALPKGPFRGVPFLLKDIGAHSAGDPFHAGMRFLRDLGWVEPHDSGLAAKFRAAGFAFLGRTNTPELGLQPTTEPQAYGPSRNPWDPTRSTGGSSGGSAAAVASGMVAAAHATDGGGSIRIPASMCGLFGLKPSRGRVSLGPEDSEPVAGLVTRHVLTRSVRDSAAILDALQGYMVGDFNTAPPPTRPYSRELTADPGKLRIGVCTHTPNELAVTDAVCIAAVGDAAALLEALGHRIEDSAPAALWEPALMDRFTVLSTASVRADLAKLGDIAGRPLTADDVEPMTWLIAETAAAYDAANYVRALDEIHQWTRRVASWWFDQGFDLLLTPTLAEPPPLLGDIGRQDDGGFNAAGRSVPFGAYTAPYNVTGQPAMSVPLYWSDSGLPIGVQLVAAPFREDLLIRVAAQLEQARPWADRRPPVHA
jgi:amidase